MRHPAARWVLFVLAAAIAAGLGYRAASLEQQALATRLSLQTATADGRALQNALAEARRAMAAMASPGQPAVSWSRQARAAIEAARPRLAALAAIPGGAALAGSTERIDQLIEAEGRLHESAVGGRTLMASDIAFGEALPHVDAIDKQVADMTARMNAEADRDIFAARQQQALAAAGALGVLALAALILTPAPPARVEQVPVAAVEAEPEPLAPRDLSLDYTRATAAAASTEVPRTAASLDLTPLAAVCGELARLSDGAALALVLERVAPAIGAKGIVVWLADADRGALQAAAAWGYDERLVARFPAVPVGDDNPTAHAFSNAAAAVVPGRAGQPAAVAAPIVGSKGPVGVLSVELTSSGAPSAALVAAAGIVAAQLATLLEPLPRRDAPSTDATVTDGPAADAPIPDAPG